MTRNFIPANRRYPLTAIRINNEFAVQGDAIQPYRSLFIGPKVAAGSAQNNIVTEITSLGDAATKLGRGSAAYDFAKGFFAQKPGHPLFVLPVDDSGFTARIATLTFTGTGIEAGTLVLYLGGIRTSVNVASGDTVAQIATNVAAALNENKDIPFMAGASAGVVTLTSKNKGIFTQDIQIAESRGASEALPGNLSVAIATTTAGAGVPATLPLTAIDSNTQYILFSTCFNDVATLGLINTELVERNGVTRKVDGYNLIAKYDSNADLLALGKAFNSQFLSIFPAIGGSTESYLAGGIAGQVAKVKANDPAASLRGMEILGAAPALNTEVQSDSQLNTYLLNGISAYDVALGKIRISILATTYKTDGDGQPDLSYFDLGVLLILSYVRYDLDRLATEKFAGAKIGREGARYRDGQKIVTPRTIEAEIINRFDAWEERGLIEDRMAFRQSLQVTRHANDVNRIDIVLAPNVVNELRILGVDIQFIL